MMMRVWDKKNMFPSSNFAAPTGSVQAKGLDHRSRGQTPSDAAFQKRFPPCKGRPDYATIRMRLTTSDICGIKLLECSFRTKIVVLESEGVALGYDSVRFQRLHIPKNLIGHSLPKRNRSLATV